MQRDNGHEHPEPTGMGGSVSRAERSPDDTSRAGQPGEGPPARPATRLLRDLLDVTEDFERSLGTQLTVNPTDLDAMQHLIMSGPLSPTDLARRIGLSPAATTTVIDRLEALNHVHREPNPADRRGVRVVPSEASRARAMATIMPMIMGVDRVLDDFSTDEQDVVTRYLERVVDVYRVHAAPPGGSPTSSDTTTSAGTSTSADTQTGPDGSAA